MIKIHFTTQAKIMELALLEDIHLIFFLFSDK